MGICHDPVCTFDNQQVGVHSKSTSVAARAEMGRYPVMLYIIETKALPRNKHRNRCPLYLAGIVTAMSVTVPVL